MAETIFPLTTVTGFSSSTNSAGVTFYYKNYTDGSGAMLEAGKCYEVIWDGVSYICTAINGTGLITDASKYLCGNLSIRNAGEDTGEPFLVWTSINVVGTMVFQFSTLSTASSHTAAVYTYDKPARELTGISATYTGGEVASGTELSALTGIEVTATYSDGTTEKITDYELSGEIVTGSNVITVTYEGFSATFTVEAISPIILKDRDGNDVPYEGVKRIRVFTQDGGTKRFLAGEPDTLEVALNFGEGDMTLVPDEGTLWTQVDIPKPVNLIPENIAKDAEIAGVVGIFEGSGAVSIDTEALKYFAYKVDSENSEIVLYGILYSELYADTGSYDVYIPDKIGTFDVVIAAGGVS